MTEIELRAQIILRKVAEQALEKRNRAYLRVYNHTDALRELHR